MAVNIDDFQKRYDQIDSILPNDDGTFTVDGKRVSASQYKKIKNEAKKRLDEEKKKAAKTVQTTSDIDNLRKQIQIDTLILAGEDLPKDLQAYQASGRFNPLPLEDRRVRLKANQAKLKEILPVGTGEEKASAGMFRQVESAFGMPSAGGGAGAGGKGGGAPGTGTGAGAGAGGRVAKEKKQKAITNWEPVFRNMFPTQAWLLDLDRTKYPQLFALLQKAVGPDKLYETQAGLERFDALLKNTDFYKELATTDKVRQVKNLVGDLGFDSMPFNAFLTKSMNMGWTGDVLAQEAYKEVFRKDDNGNYVNPTALTRVKQSKSYLDVANIGKQYFNNVDEKTIESRLTGQITNEDVSRQQRSLAKAKYGHLSDLIDQGLTLEAISDSFKRQASDILERDYNSIDMSQADFERAFNFGEEGKKRLMTSGEWEINLRSDARYGWDKTENAKREARSLASSIAQAFGKVI